MLFNIYSVCPWFSSATRKKVKLISIKEFTQYGRDCLFILSFIGSFSKYVSCCPFRLYCPTFDSPIYLLVISNSIRATTIYSFARSSYRIRFWIAFRLCLLYCPPTLELVRQGKKSLCDKLDCLLTSYSIKHAFSRF
jgi:hypothetical protein